MHRLLVVCLTLALALLAGACGADESDTSPEAGCAMLSQDTLTTLFGATNLRSAGNLASASKRQQTAAHCEISDQDTGKSLMLITVSDAKDDADVQRQADMVADEAAALSGCRVKETLPDGGYVCVDDQELVAASAGPERLIRLTLRGKEAQSLSPDRVAELIKEIDAAASATG